MKIILMILLKKLKKDESDDLNIDNIDFSISTKEVLDNSKAFSNNNNSCSFDSFIILFINSIMPLPEVNDMVNTNYIYDITQDNIFENISILYRI